MVWRQEFSWRSFGFRFNKPSAFCEAQWRWPRIVFVLYRLGMAAYIVFAFTIHMVDSSGDNHNPMVYLTNWAHLVETALFVYGAILAIFYYLRPQWLEKRQQRARADPETAGGQGRITIVSGTDNFANKRTLNEKSKKASAGETSSEKPTAVPQIQQMETEGQSRSDGVAEEFLPWTVSIYWVLSNVTQVNAIIVTVVYFTAVYTGGPPEFNNVNVHIMNSVMILVDIAVCARPIRLLHTFHPFIFGMVYVIFNVIYWSFDHEKNVLYKNVLDWNKPGLSAGVVMGLAFGAIPLLQLVYFSLYRLRLLVFQKIYGEFYHQGPANE